MAAMNKNIVVASVALLLDEQEQTRKKRRTRAIWARPWMLRRKINGDFHIIFIESKEQESGLKVYFRLDVDHFKELIHLLSHAEVILGYTKNFMEQGKGTQYPSPPGIYLINILPANALQSVIIAYFLSFFTSFKVIFQLIKTLTQTKLMDMMKFL